MSFVYVADDDGSFVVPSRAAHVARMSPMVRRPALILPVNVRRFVERAYTRRVVERARTTLARAEAIEQLEARKRAALGAVSEAPR